MLSSAEPKTATLAKACVSCRSKHLKCDRSEPCLRCRSEGEICTYVASRRGYKGPGKNKNPISDDGNASSSRGSRQEASNIARLNSQLFTLTSPNLSLTSNGNDSAQSMQVSSYIGGENVSSPFAGLNNSSHSDLFNAFYDFFYPGHPFILPRARLMPVLQTKSLPHLELAIQYVGSRYVSASSNSRQRDALRDCLTQQTLPRDGFMVQTLVLFAAGLHFGDEIKPGIGYLDSAISLALDLGMHQAEFAPRNDEDDPLLEESWKRTWWEVYILDGLATSVFPERSFSLWSIPSDVPLPCDEFSYFSGVSALPTKRSQ